MITFNVINRVLYSGFEAQDGFTFMGSEWNLSGEKAYVEGFCLSTDTKPDSSDIPWLANGSKLTEIDTTDVYLYDEHGDEWIKFAVEPEEEPEVEEVGA